MEYYLVYSEVTAAIRDLDEWMKPRPVEKDLHNKMNTIYLQPEPYGTVLIISPWNYPFELVLCPLIGALAAGNDRIISLYFSCVSQAMLL